MSKEDKVRSPLPGIFYRKPSPDKEEYVNEGDPVKEGDVIGLVEVMKNFQEVKAEKDGVLEKYHVENESEIEAGQEIATIT